MKRATKPVLIISSLCFCLTLFARRPPSQAEIAAVMQTGEELVYEVSWTVFTLGKIRVKLVSPEKKRSLVRALAYTDSYDLPFVDFHAFSTSEMDSSLFSEDASFFEKKDDHWERQLYSFNPSTRTFTTEYASVKEISYAPAQAKRYDSLKLQYQHFQDGTSILYFARAHAFDKTAIRVPTLVKGKAGYTNFYFPADRTTESIDAVPYPIKVIEMEGKAEFEGIFGLTGDFIGWFSDDGAAIPIKAKMKVILGSITLELKEWHRRDWQPPRAG
jgi:hypothetical protein